MDAIDAKVRAAAFAFLEANVHPVHRTISWQKMVRGFELEGRQVFLASRQGIFKPEVLDLPLSIRTEPVKEGMARKYEDSLTTEGFLVYKYRGTDPDHRDNAGLRRCILPAAPLVYFFGLVPGLYEARWPVRVLSEDPQRLEFLLSVDEGVAIEPGQVGVAEAAARTARAYATRTVLQRLHQASFRARVLRAYSSRCTVCRLRHEELLEAAHILPDSDPRGLPLVRNGMAMCTLHHAAFDGNVLGVRPDLVIQVRKDVLEEKDGPMLEHGLQGFHGKSVQVPRSPGLRPGPEYLEERFEGFLRAG